MPIYTQFILLLFAIFWCMWGVYEWLEIGYLAPNWQWKTFLFIVGGPCVWAIGGYRFVKKFL